MPSSKSLIGLRFGRLLVIGNGPGRPISNGEIRETCICRCDCGKEIVILKGSLTRARPTLSCRCLSKEVASEKHRIHGLHGTHIHCVWRGMKSRTRYEGSPAYKNYGERGIGLCERWEKCENFAADMGIGKKGWTIERIDNEKGYYLENCCWALKSLQNENKRNNVRLTFNGETDLALNWSKRLGIKYITLMSRLYTGWTVEDALTTPVRSQ